jgi:glycosyltransferase involved in cell wall biosynthesis
LLKWIDEFTPNVIYAQFATVDKIRFVHDLKISTGLPLVLHFMDDWPSVLVTPGLLQNHWESVVNIELKRLIDSADSCIAISEKMADEYKSRYKRDFTYMHNPVDVDKWLPSSRTSWESGSVFKILYAGRAGKGITKSIKTIADSVQELRKKDLSIEFHIYTKDFARAVLVFKNMRAVHVHPPIPDYNQLPQLFSSHDLLLLPLDFNSDFFRLSMPTKVSEYMISGTPVLVFAPRDTALSEYALKYRWAYVIDNDKSSVSEAITNLYYNESVRRELGVRAKETAVLRHNAIEIRSDFRNLLSLQREIIKGNKNDNRNILSAEKVNEY